MNSGGQPSTTAGRPSGAAIELLGVVPRDSTRHAVDQPGAPGVSLSVPGGQSLALCGQPPDVATALFDVLAGLTAPLSGEVWVDGVAVHRLRGGAKDRFRAGRGLISPRFGLLPSLSVTDNVLAAPPPSGASAPTAARAAAVLELVGVTPSIGPVTTLTNEECWRIMIARALVPAPRLLLAEDPTSFLDPRAAARVLDVLVDVQDRISCTLVLLAGRPASAARCQRRVLLVPGAVAEDELVSGDDAWTRGRVDRIG